MKKWVAALMTLALLVGLFAVAAPITASAESLYIRKIVSVVYDDSGSMHTDNRYVYANYAMQAFAGMLNSEDQLYITYMNGSKSGSSYRPYQVDLSTGGIQSSVNAIRGNDNASGGTPYDAVTSAFDTLKNVKDTNPNTEYWLVVITDGVFSNNYKEKDLNKAFEAFVGQTMPNGTKPQATFLAIGDPKQVYMPSKNESAGIYTYNAAKAGDVINVMSTIADRISGRTRLDASSIKQVDDTTLQVSSTIPLLNIAVLSQKTDAVITQAVYSSGASIPVGRSASLSRSEESGLTGGAFLVGNSQQVIEEGTYNICFNKPVKAADVVMMMEPALEMRVKVLLNGTEITDKSELQKAYEGDKLSISCKLYEMGTDNEISADLLPPGTKYSIVISEDGKTAKKSDGKAMELKDYELKKIQTKIDAAITIAGFNPITYVAEFTPTDRPIVYTMTPGFGGDKQSVKYDGIGANQDMTLTFTVLADGVPMTDKAAVEALKPKIEVSPAGNSGTTVVRNDGVIQFTPKAAAQSEDEFYDVEVTCTLPVKTGDVTAKQTYRVFIANYEVVALPVTGSVRKNEFFGNKEGASFYVTRDGKKLDKATVENKIRMAGLNNAEAYKNLSTNVTVASDGTITVVPYDEKEYKVTFGRWWFNWYRYFSLPGEDAEVQLIHEYGDAIAKLPVTGATVGYLIGCVYLPLILELLILAAIIAYIVRYFTKARFAGNMALYIGSLSYSSFRGRGGHCVELTKVPLAPYNTFKNLWNPFKELTVPIRGINFTAMKGGRISCGEGFPWYADSIRSRERSVIIRSPQDVVDYYQEKGRELDIDEFRRTQVMDEQNATVSSDESVYYAVGAELGKPRGSTVEVIESATIFCYYMT